MLSSESFAMSQWLFRSTETRMTKPQLSCVRLQPSSKAAEADGKQVQNGFDMCGTNTQIGIGISSQAEKYDSFQLQQNAQESFFLNLLQF